MLIKSASELQYTIERIAVGVGTPADNAKILADVLVGSHLAGHDSHGIQHLPRYVKEVQAGDIVADAYPEVAWESGSAALVRGNWGWGHVTADLMTRVGVERAQAKGIALIGAVEINHIGRLGHYVELAAAEGIIALISAGFYCEEVATAAPYGGKTALLAPNPIAMGFPVKNQPPVVVDFATTKIAGGKVALAQAKGEGLPPGCIIDKHGNPSTDPEDYFDRGALLPFGAHKGFGMMVAIEILSQILPGADDYINEKRGGVHFRRAGVSLIAIDSAVFSSADVFAARTAKLVSRIRAVPPASGFTEVMAPGDFEQRARAHRLKEGIPIPESTWREVVEMAESLGVQL